MKNKRYMNILLIAVVTLITTGNLYATDTTPTLKLKGDLRLRYQTEKKDSSDSRVRNRIRFRLGGESSISEKSKVKFGLATGGTDPRSTNQTFQDSFQTPDIRLDYAFVEHKLSDQTTLFGGKMKNPLWRASDLLWDSDINPDGVGIKYQAKDSNIKWFITGAYFILDELKFSEKDPYLLAIQPGIDWIINDKTKARTSVGFYLSQNLKDTTLDHSANTNTVGSSGLEKDFSSIVFSGQIDFKDQMGVALIRPFGEIVINTNKSSSNKGVIAGIKFGDQKVKGLGQWQTKVSYRYLGTDAWFDTFPDSDSYGGATNVEGLELAFNYGLSKTTTLGFDLYSMDKINGTKDKQTVVQVDLNIKF
ncbi:hypothetical protein DID80_01615 [Candidatus Marinamargulisbacteria bacterium SCGC AAA071-K20]|nr:hypothetical protein DID80_01615 [Candidatus Marinamargulisbacteria bacterium SCGC AAA071-K20]